MMRFFLCAATLVAGTALQAQTIVGAWQGTLPGGQNPRIIIKIDKAADGSLRGGIILIDRSADGLPLTSVTFAAPDVTLAQDFTGSKFTGKLAPDGHSMVGTWTQRKDSTPLTLTLATPETAWHFEGPAPMSPTADPAFEVAVIKPTGPDENQTLFDLSACKFTSRHTSAKELIKVAYNVRGRQVLGGPSCLEDDKFDVVGEPDTPGVPSEQQNRIMVRKLLEDRFHLVAHTGQQAFTVLAVTFDKNSHALRPSNPEFASQGVAYGRMLPGGQVAFNFSGESVADFISLIMNVFQANQLVDETGLTGSYDFTLNIPLSDLQGPDAQSDPDAQGDAFIAAAKQIGFRFNSKKEPLPVVVIDHIDKPTPN